MPKNTPTQNHTLSGGTSRYARLIGASTSIIQHRNVARPMPVRRCSASLPMPPNRLPSTPATMPIQPVIRAISARSKPRS